MQNIINNISGSKIIETSVSLLISFCFAFIVWLIKIAYEKRIKEIQLIAEIERILSYNNGVLNDYKELLKQWIPALKEYKAYTTRFSSFNLGKDIQTTILNLDFVNVYLPVIFSLDRLESDIANIYESYSYAVKVLMSIENQSQEQLKNWHIFNDGLLETLERILPEVIKIQNDIIKTIAHSHVLFEQKKCSIFQIITYLNRDIYPKIRKEDITKKEESIIKELEEKGIYLK